MPESVIWFHIIAWIADIGWYQRSPLHKNFTQLCIGLGVYRMTREFEPIRGQEKHATGKSHDVWKNRWKTWRRLFSVAWNGRGPWRATFILHSTTPTSIAGLWPSLRNIFLMQLDLTYWSDSSRWPQAVCVRVEYIFNMFDFIAWKTKKNPCEGHSKQQQSASVSGAGGSDFPSRVPRIWASESVLVISSCDVTEHSIFLLSIFMHDRGKLATVACRRQSQAPKSRANCYLQNIVRCLFFFLPQKLRWRSHLAVSGPTSLFHFCRCAKKIAMRRLGDVSEKSRHAIERKHELLKCWTNLLLQSSLICEISSLSRANSMQLKVSFYFHKRLDDGKPF